MTTTTYAVMFERENNRTLHVTFDSEATLADVLAIRLALPGGRYQKPNDYIRHRDGPGSPAEFFDAAAAYAEEVKGDPNQLGPISKGERFRCSYYGGPVEVLDSVNVSGEPHYVVRGYGQQHFCGAPVTIISDIEFRNRALRRWSEKDEAEAAKLAAANA